MTTYQRIEKVIRYIEERGPQQQPSLAELAKVAGLSVFHFHRLFSRWAGVTPKDFVKFLTGARAKELLRGADVLTASLEAGLSGPGRLHDLLVTVEGVTPGEYKARGAGLTIRYGCHQTPFGPAFLGLTGRGVCHLSFCGPAQGLAELKKRWPRAVLARRPSATAPVAARIFGAGGKIPVVLAGTPFQLKVWEALLRIPAGRAASYGQVAAAVGHPRAVRAVGTAVGRNAVAFLIPCHRVLRGTGLLGGYRWGAGRKRAMLGWESCRRPA